MVSHRVTQGYTASVGVSHSTLTYCSLGNILAGGPYQDSQDFQHQVFKQQILTV